MRKYLPIIFCVTAATPALAAGVKDCEGALVLDHIQYSTATSRDYRLAQFVSKDTWEEANSKFGATAILYGIPIGIDYSNYHQRAEDAVSSLSESLSEQQAESYEWVGVSERTSANYQACLKKVSLPGSFLVWIYQSDEKSVTFGLRLVPPEEYPKKVYLRWTRSDGQGAAEAPATLDATAADLGRTYTILRPASGVFKLDVLAQREKGKNNKLVDYAAESFSVSAYTSPPPPPGPKPRESWGGKGTIEEPIPAVSYGKPISLTARFDAHDREGHGGTIGGTVFLRTMKGVELGQKQVCNVPEVRGSGNLGVTMICQPFVAEFGYKYLFIRQDNHDAESTTTSAQLAY